MPEIIEKKTISEGRFLRFVSVRYADSQGIEREWEYFERLNCKGIVAIVPITDEGEAILIRQFRPPVNSHVVEFPAGLNDKGHTLEEAARRELREETGYTAEHFIRLAEGPLSPGASAELLTAYLATGLRFTGIEGRDEAEDIEVLHIPVEQVEAQLFEFRERGDYVDLKIFGFLELARKHLTETK